jgi:hypothetical protein
MSSNDSQSATEDGWKEPTRRAIAQLTARLSDFDGSSEGLSEQVWQELVSVDGATVDPVEALTLALGLLNLSAILAGRLAIAEGTTLEVVLQSIAPFAA